MIKSILNWINRSSVARSAEQADAAVGVQACSVEPLEDRLFLAVTAAPRIASVIADNRGQVVLKVDSPLAGSTVNGRSVLLFKGDQKLATRVSYSGTTRQITVTARSGLAANDLYKIRLVSSLIKGTNGKALDGEFKGGAVRSGNGRAGGDYIAYTKPRTENIARFTTRVGNIEVRLFTEQTPLTVANFLSYANAGKWDGTFFHRSVANFVIQGGGYNLDSEGKIAIVPTSPPVQNEPHPNDPGNIRGTIAMARTDDNNPNTHDDENSATSQWFFNLADNRSTLDNQNGGFTAFGRITNAEGMATMDRIANKGRVNGGGAFNTMPVMDIEKVMETGSVDAQRDLIFVKRIATRMSVVGTPPAPPASPAPVPVTA